MGIGNYYGSYKYRLHLWRLARGVLPTRVNLASKGVSCPSDCLLCEGKLESDGHVFFRCGSAKNIWSSTSYGYKVEVVVATAIGTTAAVFNVLEALPEDQRVDFAMVCWCIWRRRNKRV